MPSVGKLLATGEKEGGSYSGYADVYALTFFSFVTACSDNSVQNPTPPPVSDNGDNNNMQVVEFLRNRAMVASYNTIFPNKETERIERKGVLLSWRWLSTDPDDIGFDIYRKEGNYKFQKLNIYTAYYNDASTSKAFAEFKKDSILSVWNARSALCRS